MINDLWSGLVLVRFSRLLRFHLNVHSLLPNLLFCFVCLFVCLFLGGFKLRRLGGIRALPGQSRFYDECALKCPMKVMQTASAFGKPSLFVRCNSDKLRNQPMCVHTSREVNSRRVMI